MYNFFLISIFFYSILNIADIEFCIVIQYLLKKNKKNRYIYIKKILKIKNLILKILIIM